MPRDNRYFLPKDYRERQPRWTIAVGSEVFVREAQEKVGVKAMWRKMAGASGSYDLREAMSAYEAVFDPENDDLRQNNTFFLEISI